MIALLDGVVFAALILCAWLALGVVVCIVWRLVSDGQKRRRYTSAQPAPAADRLDRMAAEQREQPPQNLAWPPATTRPRLYAAAGQQACGCVLTTTPDGVHIITCPAHDPQFVTEWEAKL
jgi:hypothetical protein